MEIVKKAWYEYFINGTPVEETIKSSKNILDFCIPAKMKKGWRMVKQTYNKETNYYDETTLQKTNRYYIANKGSIILKKHDDGRVSEIQKGYLVDILNYHDKNKPFKDYDINYSYYINEAYKIIKELESNKNQLQLFN